MPYAKRKTTRTRKAPASRAPRRKPASRRKATYKRKAATTLAKFGANRVQLGDRPQRQIGAQPFARSMFVRLAYTDSWQQNAPSTTNLFGVTTWALNSLFDPDVTGIGHQPMQFDQLTAIYKRYWVYGAKVELEFSNPTVDGIFVGYAIRARSMVGMSGTSVAQIGELRNMVSAPMHNTGNQIKKFSFYVKMHSLVGVPKMVYNTFESQFSSAFNASPSEFAYLEVGTCSTTGSAIGVNVRLRITYFAKMYNYQTAAPS